MSVDVKGKEILKNINYEKIRDELIKSIMEKISKEGVYGCDLRLIIDDIFKTEKFQEFVKNLISEIQKNTEMDEEESKISASYLIQEDVGNEISENIKGEVEKKEIDKSENKKISEKGEEEKLWKGIRKISLGKEYEFFNELWQIFKRHFVLRLTIITGVIFLITSAILFKSVYKAILVGLTLTAFKDEDIVIKVANLLGGIGGILIFFTSFSIVLQHFLVVRSRDEFLREIARKVLETKISENSDRK